MERSSKRGERERTTTAAPITTAVGDPSRATRRGKRRAAAMLATALAAAGVTMAAASPASAAPGEATFVCSAEGCAVVTEGTDSGAWLSGYEYRLWWDGQYYLAARYLTMYDQGAHFCFVGSSICWFEPWVSSNHGWAY